MKVQIPSISDVKGENRQLQLKFNLIQFFRNFNAQHVSAEAQKSVIK